MKPFRNQNKSSESLGKVIRRLKSMSSGNSISTALSKSSQVSSNKVKVSNRLYEKVDSKKIFNKNIQTSLKGTHIRTSLNDEKYLQTSIQKPTLVSTSSQNPHRRNSTIFFGTAKEKPLICSTDLTTNWDENSRNFYSSLSPRSPKSSRVNISQLVKEFVNGGLTGEELKSKLKSLNIPITDRLDKQIKEQGRSGAVPFYEIARELHVNLR